MKVRIFIVCAVVIVVLTLIWFRLSKPTQDQAVGIDESITNQPTETEPPRTTVSLQVPSIPKTSAVPSGTEASDSTLWTSNSVWERRLTLWQAPIDFYGKVVDENNNAVAEAQIQFRWTERPEEDGTRSSVTQSDSNGLFSLHGKLGASLRVLVSKEGYYTSRTTPYIFHYSISGTFAPDPQNPVIFRLRRKGQGTELITSENGIRLKVNVRVPRDNTPVGVDLFQKQASATGQLEISQHKPPWNEATEWSFRLSISDGGLVENQDEFQFEAPETNYLPTVEYRFTKGETNWTTQVVKQFYIAFGQPRKYGWLRIESNLAQETVFLTYAINPSGSRNLEPAN